jgi:hypothetical protein
METTPSRTDVVVVALAVAGGLSMFDVQYAVPGALAATAGAYLILSPRREPPRARRGHGLS